MKKTYMEDRRTENPELKKEAMMHFLSSMGHNISKSIDKETKMKQNIQSRAKENTPVNEEPLETSTWNEMESSSLEVLAQPSQPYSGRRVGLTSKTQDNQSSRPPWMGKKCPACKKGFNSLSQVVQCRDCDSFTHTKSTCISTNTSSTENFSCRTCKPTKEVPKTTNTETTLKCSKCSTKFTTKYNLMRHIQRKHEKNTETVEPVEDQTNTITNNPVISLLKKVELEHLGNLFVEAEIDVETIQIMTAFELDKFGVKFGPAKKLIYEARKINQKRDTESLLVEDDTTDESEGTSTNEDKDESTKEDNEHLLIEDDTIEELSELQETVSFHEESQRTQDHASCMQVCKETQLLENPQHKCGFCKTAVSQICPCNIEDPESDNPQHRVHKTKDLCKSKKVFQCKVCFKTAKNEDALKSHMYALHPKYNCDECNSKFNDAALLEEHKSVHISLRPKRRNEHGENSAYKKLRLSEFSIDEETGDLDIMDDSFEDGTFSPTKEDEEVLEDDKEEDIKKKCDMCDFEEFWESEVKMHKEAKRKKNLIKSKESDKAASGKFSCVVCDKSFLSKWNLTRHNNKMHS